MKVNKESILQFLIDCDFRPDHDPSIYNYDPLISLYLTPEEGMRFKEINCDFNKEKVSKRYSSLSYSERQKQDRYYYWTNSPEYRFVKDNEKESDSLFNKLLENSIFNEANIEIKEQTGGEGEGDSASVVVYFVKEDIYVAADGGYQSYDGFSWEGSGSWYLVKPVEKTITVYEAI